LISEIALIQQLGIDALAAIHERPERFARPGRADASREAVDVAWGKPWLLVGHDQS